MDIDLSVLDSPKESPINDTLLDAVRHVESRGNPNAVSPKGALGPYQFMPATAKEYGIDPLNEEQSRGAAKQYLQKAYDKHGSLDHALAAYNWGGGNLSKKGLDKAPPETQKYIQDVKTTMAGPKPASVNLSALDTPAQPVDLSVLDKSPPIDLSVLDSPITDSLIGGTAAAGDILAPIGAAVGGIAGLGKLAMGQGLDAAVKEIEKYQKWNPSELLKSMGVESAQGPGYQTAMKPMEKLGELAGEAGGKVTDITGSPLLGTATNVVAQAVPFALGAKAAGIAGKATIRVPERAKAVLEVPKEVAKDVVPAESVGHQTTLDFEAKPVPEVKRPPEQHTALEQARITELTKPLLEPREPSGGINPETMDPAWINNRAKAVTDRGGSPIEVSDSIMDGFTGAFQPKVINDLKLTGTGNDAAAGSSRVTIMSQEQFKSMASERTGGYSSETAGRFESIREGLRGQGLDRIPRIVVDREADGTWRQVTHDGRHRADLLQSEGQHGMPVIIEDRTHGLFNKENPEYMLNQRGEKIKTPRNLYPNQPKIEIVATPEPVRLPAMSPLEQRRFEMQKAVLGRLNISAEEFIATRKAPTVDTKATLGLADGSFRTKPDIFANKDNPDHAIHALGWLDDAMNLRKEAYERILVEQVHPEMTKFLSRYHTNTQLSFAPVKAAAVRSVKAALEMEKHPETWFDGTNYSPTKEQMIAAGMDPRSAEAWTSLHKVTDIIYPEVVEFSSIAGVHLADRKPGYVPHFWEGPYKARIFEILPDGSKSFLKTISANTRAESP